ncbi:MAG: carboxymuconolactone decarboxylase family protein [Anaerolineales bacterium]
MSFESLSTKEHFYEWANIVFARSPFDAKTGNLMGLIAALVSGHDGAVSYFYFSARNAGATETELAGAADIAAAASGLNVYSIMPKE